MSFELLEPSIKAPFKAKIKAKIGTGELRARRVYLKVRGVEMVDYDRLHPGPDGDERRVPEHLRYDGRYTADEVEFEFAGETVLEPGKEYCWETEVTLPEGAFPSFRGRFIGQEWQFFAGVDTFGNDPDSGWVTVPVAG